MTQWPVAQGTRNCRQGRSAGFSLIEVIIVVALIAFVYTVAIPQFSLRSGAEVAGKLNQVAGDIRSAFDLAVLTGRPYRLVFVLATGDYWLEEADRNEIRLGVDGVDRDPTEVEEKDERQDFDTKFREYIDLAGQAVMNDKTGREIPPESPVVKAKDRLRRCTWARVEAMEWGHKTLGPNLLIKDMQAEHHGHKQDLSELGKDARAMIYVFPNGQVERAVLHIFYKKSDLVPDETQEPYSVITDPFEGVAEVVPGYQDIDVHDDRRA